MDDSPQNLSDRPIVIDTQLSRLDPDPVELLDHSLEFTFVEGRETHFPFPHTTGWRTLPFSVFSCPLDCCGSIQVEDGPPVVIKPGEGFILPTGVRHKCDSPEEGGMRAVWMHFTFRLFGGLDLFAFMEPSGIVTRESVGEGREALREVIRTHTTPQSNPFLLMAQRRGAVARFLAFLTTACTTRPNLAEALAASQRLEPVLVRIHEGYGDPLTRDELARLAGLSRTQFHRLFRQVTGMGVMEYVKHCRLQAAQTLLLTTNTAVHDVADQVGFGDAFHFTRQFTSVVGCSPRAFRHWMRQGEQQASALQKQ